MKIPACLLAALWLLPVAAGAQTSMRALFVHLWRRTEDGWRLARVLSFDQNLPKQEGPQ